MQANNTALQFDLWKALIVFCLDFFAFRAITSFDYKGFIFNKGLSQWFHFQ